MEEACDVDNVNEIDPSMQMYTDGPVFVLFSSSYHTKTLPSHCVGIVVAYNIAT
jgi:hypothetical protein